MDTAMTDCGERGHIYGATGYCLRACGSHEIDQDEPKITNDLDALTLAITLAITAPDEERAAQAAAYAERIAAGMSETDVARAKKRAQQAV